MGLNLRFAYDIVRIVESKGELADLMGGLDVTTGRYGMDMTCVVTSHVVKRTDHFNCLV